MPRKYTRKNKRRRFKRGGDIESGTVEDITPMTSIPPDPNRFKQYQDNMIRESYKPVSNKEAAALFDGPNPEEKIKNEQEMMRNEDPLNQDPFDREDLAIFSNKGGRRTRKRRRNKRKNSRRRRR
jgi:hypothetical protein